MLVRLPFVLLLIVGYHLQGNTQDKYTIKGASDGQFIKMPINGLLEDNERYLQNFSPIPDSPFKISKVELTNLEYLYFVQTNEGFIEDIDLMPQGHKWRTVQIANQYFAQKDKYEKYYFGGEKYYSYPVVNISHQQAILFCEWLSEFYNEKFPSDSYSYYFRLPSHTEYISLVRKLKFDSIEKMKKNSEKYNHHLRASFSPYRYNRGGLIIRPINYCAYNRLNLCNLIGNVAEYTYDGDVFGGSYDDTYDEIYRADHYEATDPRVGFRLVLEKIKK